jgi:hypothetical protein
MSARTSSLARTALLTAAMIGTTSAVARPVEAQSTPARWEFVIPGGRLIPTGSQRGAIRTGGVTAAQLAYVPRPSLAVTATLGWARSRDVTSLDQPKLDIFTFDVGGEVRAPRWLESGAISFGPFAGAGVGARMYNHRNLDRDATHNLAAYASAGGELGYRRVRLRVEARDYVTRFGSLGEGGAPEMRNDVAVLVGLRIASR